mmetsp:Transcript_13191/g.33222  ORF Transcript_13191/g.33222 Transcript_13191/m.33222 type:complete len:139 (+) Transcript_13191:45-461(+)
MPKKGKGKSKGPSILVDDMSLKPFGFKMSDILLTPLGVEVTVIGVKPDSTGQPKLWAEFQSGFQSPLEPTNPQEFTEQGYKRVHEGRHIMRNKALDEGKKKELLDEVDWATVMPWLSGGNNEEEGEKKEDPKAAKKKK